MRSFCVRLLLIVSCLETDLIKPSQRRNQGLPDSLRDCPIIESVLHSDEICIPPNPRTRLEAGSVLRTVC
jgi:hypothetical protein